ncbi:ATP-binding cassette domain-containing protein [Anaerococcus cruorum]|uniref:ATP-binding cassette domain-containing protein n=1 Tax=Anaerococcus sp. WGS1529 TaxID=3366812 RepID=UPI00372D5F77
MIVEAININKSFDNKKVLNNVSLCLEKGMISGLVGRNGSGKTTLLKILAGIYNEDSGKIKIAGNSLKVNPKTIKHLAYLPDRFDYFNYYKINQLPEYYKILYPDFDREFFESEVKKFSFEPSSNIRNLSKGEKNILGLIVMLASNADVILVDEVLDGMDVLNRRRISEYLLDAKEKGCAVFISSHELAELSNICDFIYYLTKDGTLKETREDNDNSLHKLQVVVKDHLPENIANNSVIISNIGRVYTILIDAKDEELDVLLSDEQIVQYDKLEVKIEDYFYLEEGAR